MPTSLFTPPDTDDPREIGIFCLRLAKYAVELARHELKVQRAAMLAGKANFNPAQPREDNGKWVFVPGYAQEDVGGGGKPGDGSEPRNPGPAEVEKERTGLDTDGSAPVSAEWDKAKQLRDILKGTIARLGLNHPFVRFVFAVYEGVQVLASAVTYFDAPQDLEVLRNNVTNNRFGTEVHHIVELKAGLKAGFPIEWLNGPDNLVRIPTLRHHEINGFYSRRVGGMPSLRDQLAGASWDEHRAAGLDALRRAGVLR